MEGRKIGKPMRDRRLQMLDDLYENNGYKVLKRTAEVIVCGKKAV